MSYGSGKLVMIPRAENFDEEIPLIEQNGFQYQKLPSLGGMSE